jgi:hypothetical protein
MVGFARTPMRVVISASPHGANRRLAYLGPGF